MDRLQGALSTDPNKVRIRRLYSLDFSSAGDELGSYLFPDPDLVRIRRLYNAYYN
jgi:hypothetical protein